MRFRFNARGFIMPYQKIKSSVAELEEIFVKPFPNSDTRNFIFEQYLNYLNDFKTYITPHFTQWLDGSFISKKINPNDFDFVTFINNAVYSQKEEHIFKIIEKYGYLKLDSYVSPVFSESQRRYNETLQYKNYWNDLFSHSRRDPITNLQEPRGFIEIIF